MKINIPNAEDAGMPDDMIANCTQLLERRISKTITGMPMPGTDIEILYSDKDPLGTSDEVDDEAYLIYFSIKDVKGDNIDNAEIDIALME